MATDVMLIGLQTDRDIGDLENEGSSGPAVSTLCGWRAILQTPTALFPPRSANSRILVPLVEWPEINASFAAGLQ